MTDFHHVEKSLPEHVGFIAAGMRDADKAEAWAARHHDPFEATWRSYLQSVECYTGLCGGKPVCMFGVGANTLLSRDGSPWMLGTKDLSVYVPSLMFLRLNRAFVEYITPRYDSLVNFVDARNLQSIDWLRWLGFTIYPAKPYGVEQLPFHKFEMTNV